MGGLSSRWVKEQRPHDSSNSATCYSCHPANGAVDNTFVQFYPTLLAIAKEKGTLNPAYLAAPKQATRSTLY